MARNSIIDGCIRAEKSAATIYKNFMRMFPEHKEFWKDLFDDEIKHLSFLKDVKSLGLVDELQKRGPLPSVSLINKTLKLADDITEKTKGTSLSIDKALKMVLKLEESVMETYTNKMIADLMSCGNKTLEEIIADEKAHIRKIKGMMRE